MRLNRFFKKSIWYEDYQRSLYNLYYDSDFWRYKENSKLITTLTSQCAQYSIRLVTSMNAKAYLGSVDPQSIDQFVSPIFPTLSISQYQIEFEPSIGRLEIESENIIYGVCTKETINSIRLLPVVTSSGYTPQTDQSTTTSHPNHDTLSNTSLPPESIKNENISFWTKILGK